MRSALAIVPVLMISAGNAGAQAFAYAMNEFGQVFLNGSKLLRLPSDFDPEDGADPEFDERWVDQVVIGRDLYHLRRDGVVYKNGERLFGQTFGADNWIRIDVDPLGAVYAFTSRGHISRDGTEIRDLPSENDDSFRDFLVHGGVTYALHKDGRIFENDLEHYDLPGTGSDEQRFVALARDPLAFALCAIRVDGNVYRAEPGGAAGGVFVADLPGSGGLEQYVGLWFDASGMLWTLREDGVVYQVDPTSGAAAFYADYHGDGTESCCDFRELGVLGPLVIAVRWDGAVFQGHLGESLCNLEKRRFVCVDLAALPPATVEVKEHAPVVPVVKTTCYTGDLVRFPVLATDVDDAVLDYAVLELPPGATFDAGAEPPHFSWTAGAPGKYVFALQVSDDQRTKTYSFPIRVGEPDGEPQRNKQPVFPQLGKVQAFAGVQLDLPFAAYDADSDALSYSASGLIPGMTFDPLTATLSWIPPLCSGEVKLELFAEDGRGGRAKRQIKISVVSAFHF